MASRERVTKASRDSTASWVSRASRIMTAEGDQGRLASKKMEVSVPMMDLSALWVGAGAGVRRAGAGGEEGRGLTLPCSVEVQGGKRGARRRGLSRRSVVMVVMAVVVA
jgi:hypothetical protein